MKNNAVVRICLYSLLILLLLGTLLVGMIQPRLQFNSTKTLEPEATYIPVPIIGTATVRELVKLRAAPTEEASETGFLTAGQTVEIEDFTDVLDIRWYCIAGEHPGWVREDFLKLDQPDEETVSTQATEDPEIITETSPAGGTAVILKQVTLYQSPSEQGTVAGTLKSGDQVEFDSVQSVMGTEWVHITSAPSGWACKDFVKIQETETTEQTE